MSILNLFKRKPKVKGRIGYYGLTDWWLTILDDSDRKRIIDRFQPLGSTGNVLTEGEITYISESVIQFLSILSGWFYKREDREIALKIISKAEKLIDETSNSLDIHFLFGAKIDILYKDRDQPGGMERAIEACNQQIAFSSNSVKAIQKERKGNPPSHKGYKQLAIVREKQREYTEAIVLCEQAMAQGWAGDWEKRIERCQRKADKVHLKPSA